MTPTQCLSCLLYSDDPLTAVNGICSRCAYEIDLERRTKAVAGYRPVPAAPQEIPQAFDISPSEIIEYLDKFVIGQDEVKESLAVVACNHMVKALYNQKEAKRVGSKGIKLKRDVLLITGPTGSGKTLSISKLAEYLQLPFLNIDCTALTCAGYVGLDIEEAFATFMKSEKIVDDDIFIVYLDEIDKLARQETNTKDIGGAEVQKALLKLMEGETMFLPSKNGSSTMTFKTSNILFILSGAFTDLRETLDKKSKKDPLGFANEPSNKEYKITTKDLIDSGMVRELIGRISRIVEAKQLEREDFIRIIEEPEDSLLKQYELLFELRGLEWKPDELDIKGIVDEAIAKKVGARGLKMIFEERLHKQLLGE